MEREGKITLVEAEETRINSGKDMNISRSYLGILGGTVLISPITLQRNAKTFEAVVTLDTGTARVSTVGPTSTVAFIVNARL